MTTGPIVREKTMDSGTGSEPRNAVITDVRVSTKSNLLSDRKFGNRAEDKLNDIVIDENFRQRVVTMMTGIALLPENWNELTVREQRDWMYVQVNRQCANLPKTLTFMCVGTAIMGDCKRSHCDQRPEWLDHDKFLRGQRFAMNNMAGLSFAELISLYALFSFENALKPMIITGKSSEPFTSFKRYLSTSKRIINWYSSDVWTKGTLAHGDMETVRKMHSMVRERLTNSSVEDIDEASRIDKSWNTTRVMLLEDFRDSCPIAASGQCPYAFNEEEKFKRSIGLNQGEMAATQFGFIGLVILYPERFGIHGSTDDDLDAFCHVWRSLGYLLGIEDEFNFCTGSLEEVKQRSRDIFQYWVKPNLRDVTPEWEHMLRCVMEGLRYYFPKINSYEQGLLYIAEILDIRMPRLRASMSYRSWIRYNIMKNTFYWTARLPGVQATMTRHLIASIERALNYTDAELEVLKKKSNYLLSKGIAETIAVNRKNESTTPTYWHKAPFFVFLSTCLLLNFPIMVKDFAKKWFRIDTGATMTR